MLKTEIALVCDRCGRETKDYSSSDSAHFHVNKAHGQILLSITGYLLNDNSEGVGAGGKVLKKVDLCCKCAKALFKFLDIEEQEEMYVR